MSKGHWEQVYETRRADQVSWFQERAELSLALLKESGVAAESPVIDIGGGASTFVDDLLLAGYEDVTVVDIADSALSAARRRLGPKARDVQWVVGDVTELALPEQTYDFWHDRAAFHFLTSANQRQAYRRAVLRSLTPGGYVMVATFADDGPTRCSGLPVMRYSATQLHMEFGSQFSLVRHTREEHRTPAGATQAFTYCLLRKAS